MKTRPGPGMTAGNMRQNGVRHLLVSCTACRHEALLNADRMPDDAEIHSLDHKLKCSHCGSTQCSLMPNWRDRPVRESLTGAQYHD